MKTLGLAFFYLSIFSALLPLVVGFKRRSSLLWTYVLASFSCDILMYVLRWWMHASHLWVGNVFVSLEVLILTAYYGRQLKVKPTVYYTAAITLCMLFCIHTLALPGGYNDFNSFGYSIINFILILYVIAGFYTILKDSNLIHLERSAFFWVNTAFLIYASGNFLLFLFNKYLQQNDDLLFIILWSVSFKLLNIIKNIILAVALSKKTSDIEPSYINRNRNSRNAGIGTRGHRLRGDVPKKGDQSSGGAGAH